MPVVYKIIGGDGREYGPATLEEIRGWCEDGRVGGGTPVWRDDELRWQPARNREELRWDLPAAAHSPNNSVGSGSFRISLQRRTVVRRICHSLGRRDLRSGDHPGALQRADQPVVREAVGNE